MAPARRAERVLISPAAGRAWQIAYLSMRVMTVSNALLLGYVHLLFAHTHPDYYNHAWPSFSRALSEADVTVYRWIAAIAAAGQIGAGTAMAFLQQRESRGSPIPRASRAITWAWGMGGALGIVHYLHLTIVVNTPVHTLLSFVFFVGMTLYVITDAVSVAALRAKHGNLRSDQAQRASSAVAVALVVIALLFLATFLLKGDGSSPLQAMTQKVFVASEIAWVVLCHAYGLLRLKYLDPRRAARAEPRATIACTN